MGNKIYAIINNIFCLSMNDMKWNCSFPMNTIASVNGRNTTHSEKRKLRISIIRKMRPRIFSCINSLFIVCPSTYYKSTQTRL